MTSVFFYLDLFALVAYKNSFCWPMSTCRLSYHWVLLTVQLKKKWKERKISPY